jgi:hypothetical protein
MANIDTTAAAVKEILREAVTIAHEMGVEFRQREGRDPTENEAAAMADMVTRQLRVALAVSR